MLLSRFTHYTSRLNSHTKLRSSNQSLKFHLSNRSKTFIPNMSLQYTQERAQELISNADGIKEEVDKLSGGTTRLVCVSKLKPASDIQALYDHGYRHFGENYVQELVEKSKVLPKDIEWHFIGGLQTNKCKELAKIDNLYAVETIDTEKKAKKLNDSRENTQDQKVNVYIQINSSGEEQKSGVLPTDVETIAKYIVEQCPKIQLEGLMTIGSLSASKSSEENEDFKVLVGLKNALDKLLSLDLKLSMGMSSDFQEAIRQGSTSVRVGSDIFGSRPPRNGH